MSAQRIPTADRIVNRRLRIRWCGLTIAYDSSQQIDDDDEPAILPMPAALPTAIHVGGPYARHDDPRLDTVEDPIGQ